jgi:formate dehydrogenase major subunit
MKLSRRDFLKISGVATGGLLLPTGAALASGAFSYKLHKPVGEVPTICPFCAVGCGALVGVQDGLVVNVEGDPDHPVNQGSLCSKGMSLAQLNTVDGKLNENRLTTVKYRAPGSDVWEEKDWEWALDKIAENIKKTRDEYFIAKDSEGRTANRLEAIASLGGAALDSEECSLIVKAMRALGLVYIEHQARI